MAINLEKLVQRLELYDKQYNKALNQADKSAARVSGNITRRFDKVGKVFRTAGLAATAFSIAIGVSATAMSRSVKAIDQSAKALGISIKRYQEFRTVFDTLGITTEEFNGALAKISLTIGRARAGSTEAQKVFKDLGLSLEEVANLSTDKQFEAITEALGKVTNETDKFRLSSVFFEETFHKFLPIINDGLGKMVGNMGRVATISQKTADVFSKLSISFTLFKADALAKLTTTLKPVAERMTAFFDSMRDSDRLDALVTGIGKVVKWMADLTDTISVTTVALTLGIGAVVSFGGAIIRAIVSVSRFLTGIAAMNVVLGGLIRKSGILKAVLAGVVVPVDLLKQGLLSGSKAVGSFDKRLVDSSKAAEKFGGALGKPTGKVKRLGSAVKGLSRVLLANPLVLGAAAITAGIYAVGKATDKFSDSAIAAADKVKKLTDSVSDLKRELKGAGGLEQALNSATGGNLGAGLNRSLEARRNLGRFNDDRRDFNGPNNPLAKRSGFTIGLTAAQLKKLRDGITVLTQEVTHGYDEITTSVYKNMAKIKEYTARGFTLFEASYRNPTVSGYDGFQNSLTDNAKKINEYTDAVGKWSKGVTSTGVFYDGIQVSTNTINLEVASLGRSFTDLGPNGRTLPGNLTPGAITNLNASQRGRSFADQNSWLQNWFTEMNKEGGKFAQGFQSNLSTAFTSVLDGTEKLSNGFDSLILGFRNSIIKSFSDSIAKDITSSIFGGVITGGVNSVPTAPALGASGVRGRQFGGPVNAGQWYRVNEGVGQKEFFKPNTSGTVYPDAASVPNSGTTINVNVQGDMSAQVWQEVLARAPELANLVNTQNQTTGAVAI